MAFKSNGSIIVTNDRAFDNLANVTIQNSGNLTITSADTFQGTVSGYSSGGTPSYTDSTNVIEKFPFSSDSNATDVGDLTAGKYRAGTTGQSSSVSGYTAGSGPNTPPAPRTNVIEKFPFSTNNNSTDVGDLPIVVNRGSGQSSSLNGYQSGGAAPGGSYITNSINKFPFATDTNGSDVGDLLVAKVEQAGQSSTTHGYTTGGTYPANVNNIDKFPFASDTNASDVGDLTSARSGLTGQSSTTHGYTSGSGPKTSVTNTIDKFPFASDTNATDVGDLSQARFGPSGQSSTTHGYSSGGSTNWPGNYTSAQVNTIDKFPFSTDSNATDVGDTTAAKFNAFGQQD